MDIAYPRTDLFVRQIKHDSVSAVRIAGLGNYSVSKTLDCGQCFRFERSPRYRHEYEGVAHGKYIRVYQEEDYLDEMIIVNCKEADFWNIWYKYFALDRPWTEIREDISSRSPVLAHAAELAGDIRILSQDPFEALVSFIISQCNNIPRIKGLVEALCERYGDKKYTPEGDVFYTFPTPERILDCPSGLSGLKLGYRDKYIYAAACAARDGIIDKISEAQSTAEAEKMVRSIEGVGPKVAACALLFGFERYDAFPVDVWMKRALARLFPGCRDYSVFGPYAGVAQQYMFYCERYLEGK